MCLECYVEGSANLQTAMFTLILMPCKAIAFFISNIVISYIVIICQLLFVEKRFFIEMDRFISCCWSNVAHRASSHAEPF